jgi:hypothetical protein
MNTQEKTRYVSAIVLAASIALVAPGWEAGAQTSGSSIVEGKTAQGLPYMMGGVGSEERAAMESHTGNYNVKLAFAEKAGVYLANVDVFVHDRSGREILNVTTNGPWLYVQLPPGAYNIRAAFDDKIQRISDLVVKPGRRAARILRWDLPQEFPIYARLKEGKN